MAIYNFIDPVAGAGTAGVLSAGSTFIAGNAGDIGLWNVGTGAYMNTGTDTYAATDFLSASYAGASTIDDVDTADGSVNIGLNVDIMNIVPDQFQVVQHRASGQMPFATPIINRYDVEQINYRPYVAPAAEEHAAED